MSRTNLLILIAIPVILSIVILSLNAISEEDIPKFFVPPPPFSEGIFPCSDCHDGSDVDTKRRELSFHEEITLKHAERNRWCLDCHDATNRDMLRLANGDHVSFKESYILCGQCHGTIFRDWKVGVHGRRTGMWNGPKQYLLCVHCHSPHQPRFKPIEPMSPPVKPENIKLGLRPNG
jgi:uncharacterized CHY-type Zn-finger protein